MAKQPKIVQMLGNNSGVPISVLYDDGRIFYYHVNKDDVGKWAEPPYPIPRISIPSKTARKGRRGRKQK